MTAIVRLRRRMSVVFLALFCAGASAGCYTFHLYQAGGVEGREAGSQPGTEWEFRTRHSFLWGAVRQDLAVENCRLGDGRRLNIEEVRVDTNLAFLAASVATLGIWVPVRLGWRCARPVAPTNG
jgi:hypothetical protein